MHPGAIDRPVVGIALPPIILVLALSLEDGLLRNWAIRALNLPGECDLLRINPAGKRVIQVQVTARAGRDPNQGRSSAALCECRCNPRRTW